MTEESEVELYSSWFCLFAQRVWIGLLAKGIPFNYVEIDPYAKTPHFLALNPRGLVPTLRHGGKTVYESAICLEYLDEMWPNKETKFLPGGVEEVVKAMDPIGPFFRGTSLTLFDIMLAPFALRFASILDYYRDFKVPREGEWERWELWLEEISRHPSLSPTVAEEGKLRRMYQRYADNNAKSLVATAIRQGTPLP